MWTRFAHKTLCGANFLRPNPIANLRQKTCRNAAGRARGHYGAGSALQEPHTARPNQSSVGMASTNPRGGSMGLQGPPYAVLSPLVTDPLAPSGDPESSLFLTCHFVRKGPTRTKSPDWAKPPWLIRCRTNTYFAAYICSCIIPAPPITPRYLC